MSTNTATQAQEPNNYYPPVTDAEAYKDLLKTLAQKGEVQGKTKDVAAYHLPNIRVVTENNSGPETVREIKVEDTYLVFDLAVHPHPGLRRALVKGLAVEWANRAVADKDINDPDFAGPGLWVVKSSTFADDYQPTDNPEIFRPAPNSTRVLLQTPENIVIPTSWGEDFQVPATGHLAMREKDLPAVIEALHSIDTGEKTAAEALFVTTKDSKTASRFDMYGMMPYFADNNYAPVEPNDATKKLRAAFSSEEPSEEMAKLLKIQSLEKELDSLTGYAGYFGDDERSELSHALIRAVLGRFPDKIREALAAGASFNWDYGDRWRQTLLDMAKWDHEQFRLKEADIVLLKGLGALTTEEACKRELEIEKQLKELRGEPDLSEAAHEVTGEIKPETPGFVPPAPKAPSADQA